ncbi:MAG: hypothetical protein ABR604_04360 [Jatrophihabitantaceae bacterium]
MTPEMMIIGLLLVALVCVVLGVVLQSAVWLVASLIATAGAGFLLYKLRDVIAAPKSAVASEGLSTPDDADAAAPARDAEHGAVAPRGVVASNAATGEPGPADVAAASAKPDDDQVWVIDGRPRYHLGDCPIIKGQAAEVIPFEQATDDGFTPCALCEPRPPNSPSHLASDHLRDEGSAMDDHSTPHRPLDAATGAGQVHRPVR